jgi:hypothetical protein
MSLSAYYQIKNCNIILQVFALICYRNNSSTTTQPSCLDGKQHDLTKYTQFTFDNDHDDNLLSGIDIIVSN